MRYKASVAWTMMGTVEVEADDQMQARQKVLDAPLPLVASYLEDSFEIDSLESLGLLDDDLQQKNKGKNAEQVLEAFKALSEDEKQAIATRLMFALKPSYSALGYAVIIWSWDDLQSNMVKPDWSEEECRDWMANNADKVIDANMEHGWEVLSILTQED